MTRWIIKKCIKNHGDTQNPKVRKRYGACSSVAGLCCNFILFAVKYLAGTRSGSFAIVSDAFNNLTDCAGCLVTLLGLRLAAKPADAGHPYGHGRAEYLTSLVMSLLVGVLGFEVLRSSVDHLLHPTPISFHVWTLCVVLFSICVKIWLWRFNRILGRAIQSSVLLATAKDSLGDVLATAGTVAALLFSPLTSFPLDGLIGIFVSLFIFKSAWDILKDTVDSLLGKPADPAVLKEIRREILSHDGIEGVHDLVLHDYGPGRTLGSCHAEVRADANLREIHAVVDGAEREILENMHIHMTIHMDPMELDDEEVQRYKAIVETIAREVDPELGVHDFRLMTVGGGKKLVFDLAVPFSCKLPNKSLEHQIQTRLREKDSGCTASIVFDRGYCG